MGVFYPMVGQYVDFLSYGYYDLYLKIIFMSFFPFAVICLVLSCVFLALFSPPDNFFLDYIRFVCA